MKDLSLEKQKIRIDNEEYSEAMLFSLTSIDNFANIEEGSHRRVAEKYENWFKKYAIDKFDVLKTKFPELNEYKINKQEISTLVLNNIHELDTIIYKFRCSYVHSGITKIDYPNAGDGTIVELCVDEDNVLEVKDNNVKICPMFFSKWIYFSIIEYTDEIIANTTDTKKKDRYEKYINCSPQKTKVTIKPNPIKVKAEISLDVIVAFHVEADNIVTIEDAYFDVHKKTKTHRCEYCRSEIESIDEKGTMVKYSPEDSHVKRFYFKNHDPRLKEIETKINKYS